MADPKRVLLVVHRFWPHPGGSERLFYNVARRLAARGLEITVFTTDAWHPESYHKPRRERLRAGIETHEGMTVRRFPVRNIPLQYRVLRALSLLPFDAPRQLCGPPYVLVPGYVRELFKGRARFDLVVAGVLPYTQLIYPAARLARRQRIPWVCVPLVHTGVEGDDVERAGYLTRPQLKLMRRADALVTATDAEGRVLEARGLDPSRLHRVGVGVEPEELAGGDAERFRARFGIEGPAVLQVSTMSRAKGVIDLVEALKLSWSSGGEAKLVLVGPPMSDFEDYFSAQPESVRSRVLFLGLTDEATKRDAFAACDVFAMASSVDSFGTVFLEAWLYGKPVIGAHAGGIPDVITEGRDGLLVDFGRPRELAGAVSRLLGDAELRRALGERGRRKVLSEYTWDVVFGRFARVVDPLLARGDAAAELTAAGLGT